MRSVYREVSTDILIVGSGGAALRAALEADARGADVLMAIKGEFQKSGASYHSVAEVGAFNVPDGASDPDDNPEVYLADILRAAQDMADPRLSAILAEEAGEALRYLEERGVPFERDETAYLVYQACFSSKPRSHVIPNHFKPIVHALGAEATRRNIKVIDRLMITNLIVRDGQCLGAYAIDHAGRSVVLRAKATILTTGGASQLFEKNLYPSDITGDGYAMAHRAGAHLVNMEFMQAGISLVAPFVNLFGNYLWDARPNITDRDNRAFIQDYLPPGLSVGEVMLQKQRHFPFSASDISRYIEISIQKAINAGRGTDLGGVYLDFVGRDFEQILGDKNRSIAKMWPLTYEWHRKRGVDLYRDRVQIACSAHAINGGLRIDANAQSNIEGLYAAGEVAAGPHGADRLGGNMSVTCQVFGRRAGKAAAERAVQVDHLQVADVFAEERAFLDQFRANGEHKLEALKRELQRSANRSLLIIRDEAGLTHFKRSCEEARAVLFAQASIVTPQDLIKALEINNLIDVGLMMATAALARKESRGSHYREDHPERDIQYARNIILDRSRPGGYFMARLCEL
ncbi:MAG: FAD-binding protein [Burkholderiales bacterium]|nr:FAD-binding protein [Burkholderiales bacterium]